MIPKILFLSFLFLILSIALTSAFVVPNKLKIEFDLVQGEKSCQIISVSSDRPTLVKVKDNWAETADEGGNLREYTLTAKDHEIDISYMNNLDFTETDIIEINVCLTAYESGDYKGAMIFAPEIAGSEGTVVQFASWLLVHVSEQPAEQNNQNTGGSGGGGGSSGGGNSKTSSSNSNSGSIGVTTASIGETDKEKEILKLAAGVKETEGKRESGAGITGKAIEESGGLSMLRNIIPVVFILFIAVAAIIVRKRRKEKSFN